ncbi:MAG TPA: bifunctional phosphopantothenoylcysteine decarboxylase/phosphopantothenate--cysteine ligase CoaBC [Abditibacteriaceae bacterium]|jgi:phosphopantothenoylcysteine decarboxylase/phosphopantothenate--cysteine ligase
MQGKTIVLGVSGGIAAYKACELASRLTQAGARVHVVMTSSAQRFVTPLTFQALTHQPVHTSLWPDSHQGEAGVYAAMAHIALADEADAILVAPASANTIARLAHGLADDLLSTLVLATSAPVLVSPAMNPRMLSHPATQKNLHTLRKLGYTVIEPESGRMACEHVGAGRLPETAVLIAALQEVWIRSEYSERQDLAGKTVLVTAGPTREAIDAVRFISNRSSGKMGYAIAEEAAARGARVTLVSGPTQLAPPPRVETHSVTTTQQMLQLVTQHAPEADIVIAAAAPADYRARSVFAGKLKKSSTQDGTLSLQLEPNPDIIAQVGKSKAPHQLSIGFAAETSSDIEEARRKLHDKNLDAIVLNDVTQTGAGFDVETNRVTWVTTNKSEEWPLLSKREVAARILDQVLGMRR